MTSPKEYRKFALDCGKQAAETHDERLRTYDWTDRSRERELHDYYRTPYYWDPDRH